MAHRRRSPTKRKTTRGKLRVSASASVRQVPPADSKRRRVWRGENAEIAWVVYDPISVADIRAYSTEMSRQIEECRKKCNSRENDFSSPAIAYRIAGEVLGCIDIMRSVALMENSWRQTQERYGLSPPWPWRSSPWFRRAEERYAICQFYMARLSILQAELVSELKNPALWTGVTRRTVSFCNAAGTGAIEAIAHGAQALRDRHAKTTEAYLFDTRGKNHGSSDMQAEDLFACPYSPELFKKLIEGLPWPSEADDNRIRGEMETDYPASRKFYAVPSMLSSAPGARGQSRTTHGATSVGTVRHRRRGGKGTCRGAT